MHTQHAPALEAAALAHLPDDDTLTSSSSSEEASSSSSPRAFVAERLRLARAVWGEDIKMHGASQARVRDDLHCLICELSVTATDHASKERCLEENACFSSHADGGIQQRKEGSVRMLRQERESPCLVVALYASCDEL